MPTVAFFTLGCKVNQQETAALVASFRERGFSQVSFKDEADVYVVNSCAVTAEAERKSLSAARKVKRQHPTALMVLAGCFPQVALDRASTAGADLLIGSNDKGIIVDLVERARNERGQPVVHVTQWNEDATFESIFERADTDRARATLKVQDGCEQYCSYCIIPQARGPERSLPLADVVSRTRALVSDGFREVVLSGIHLGAYGKDLTPPTTLSDMVGELLKIPSLERLRLGSVEPNDIDHNLMMIMAQNQRLCSHLHIPLQSGCDQTLARMNRRYTTTDFRRLLAELRSTVPGLSITSDVIVGFPGETEEEFLETLDFLKEMAFLRTHVFRYSSRVGTRAAELRPQIPEAIKGQRSALAQKVTRESSLLNHRSWIGKSTAVLVESYDNGELSGHSPSYLKVHFPGRETSIGETIEVRIHAATDAVVYAHTLQD
jgi:threonylcarbamoyladenosine tRNA methylthiotransferase MtaB